ncbi:DUF695 domain-containing protein [Nocardiopsis sp. EMB25]|uniref:DUF695 domain-containing protein n=1 Tax=Nocardiopsis sp. EMB25 TaxID=2835867 RepID=UPI0022836132|nr:DUF695 domain-containing protein [Nocardiopsis sp. EMB25]MCY9787751.1 DUF695 domain-containing protein [Nocardiopsis sp. EMB25]
MALFRRRRSADSTTAVTAFWDAWPEVRDALANAVESAQPAPAEVSDRVTSLVKGIHPDLDWEVGRPPEQKGGDIEDLDLSPDVDPSALLEQLAALDDPSKLTGGPTYAMTLRPGPSDDARVMSERWARSAPDDEQWGFHPVRPADHERLSSVLTVDGHELDLSHVSVSLRVNQATGKIEVGVYHPDNMFLPEEVREGVAEQVTLLALGEDDMVRWIGEVDSLDEPPLDPLPPTSMPSVARQMADLLGGSEGWVTLEGTHPLFGAVRILIRHPLTRRDFPALSLYVQVVVPFATMDAEKRPIEASEAALGDLEARLEGVLRDNGALFAQKTERGERHYHYYLDPESGVLPEFEAQLVDWPEGKVKLRSELDPDWAWFNAFRRQYRRELGS